MLLLSLLYFLKSSFIFHSHLGILLDTTPELGRPSSLPSEVLGRMVIPVQHSSWRFYLAGRHCSQINEQACCDNKKFRVEKKDISSLVRIGVRPVDCGKVVGARTGPTEHTNPQDEVVRGSCRGYDLRIVLE